MAMKKIAAILALAFPSITGMALTAAFAFDLLPLLSTDACFIAKDGTGQLSHFEAVLPSHFPGRIAVNFDPSSPSRHRAGDRRTVKATAQPMPSRPFPAPWSVEDADSKAAEGVVHDGFALFPIRAVSRHHAGVEPVMRSPDPTTKA
jgi:hypothetical protein